MDTAAPDAAFDGADGSRFVRRSGAWNDHDARCVASFMDAARASGFSSVQVLYGELKLKAFVQQPAGPQPSQVESAWTSLQQSRVSAMQAEQKERARVNGARAAKEKTRKAAQKGRKKAAAAEQRAKEVEMPEAVAAPATTAMHSTTKSALSAHSDAVQAAREEIAAKAAAMLKSRTLASVPPRDVVTCMAKLGAKEHPVTCPKFSVAATMLPDVLGSRLTCAGDESQMEAVLTALWGPAPGTRPPSYSPRRLGEPNG